MRGDDVPGGAPPIENHEIEQALLAAVLVSNGAYDKVADFLKAEHFGLAVHARIFQTIATLIDRGTVANPVTVGPFFANDEALREHGGASYLMRLAANVVSVANAADYGRQIFDLWKRRQLVSIADDITSRATTIAIDETADNIASESEERLFGVLSADARGGGPIAMADTLTSALEAMDTARQNGGKITGVPTGIDALDRMLGGLEPGELYVVAGRPSMGKQQPIDEPVLTPFGWRRMGEILSGDRVIGSDGLPVRVMRIIPQGLSKAFRLTFWDGGTVECGAEHLWSVAPSSGRSRKVFRVLSLAEILASGVCAKKKNGRAGAKWRVPVAGPAVFAAREPVPIDPYVLGVLIGDGATSGRDLRFSNPDMDSDIRANMASRLALADVSLHENRSGACPYFSLRGPGRGKLRDAIKSLGLNVKSPAKFLPQKYKLASVDERLLLLRGLMDTDGGMLGGSACFYTTSLVLANDVVFLVRSLGGIAKLRKYNRAHHGKPTDYVVCMRVPLCPFLTDRKAKKWARPRSLGRYLRSVEFSRSVDQVCIEVEAADGLYVSNDFIVTHNSTLAHNIASHAARVFRDEAAPTGARPKSVLIFSLEMTAVNLSNWSLAAASGIDHSRIRHGRVSAQEVDDLVGAAGALRSLPISIDDTPRLSVAEMRLRARRIARGPGGLGLLAVDHLGLISPPKELLGQGETAQITEITRSLKALAKELGVPLIALSQLNRGVEARDDKRPLLADLRSSGSIEQDADVVMFVYREHYYLSREEPVEKPGENEQKFRDRQATHDKRLHDTVNTAQIIVAKHRVGATGHVDCYWDGARAIFGDRPADVDHDTLL